MSKPIPAIQKALQQHLEDFSSGYSDKESPLLKAIRAVIQVSGEELIKIHESELLNERERIIDIAMGIQRRTFALKQPDGVIKEESYIDLNIFLAKLAELKEGGDEHGTRTRR